MKKHLIDLWIYRQRYIIGYAALIVLFITSVTLAGLYTPGGLTQAEVNSVGYTNEVADGNFAVPNVPFHLLRLASFELFGVSILSVKSPAIILSVIATITIFFLLRRWFKPNIVVLSMLIMITTGQFIFVAQNATSTILYVTYTALILLFASLIIQKAKHQLLWKICLAITVALSCMTPYFIYINIGLLIVALIHPHTRHHLFKRSQRRNWLIAAGVLLLCLAPLIYVLTRHPEFSTQLIGYDYFKPDIINNLKVLVHTFFWVTPTVINSQITPVMDFSALALIILGAIVMFRQRYTARAYMITAWIIIALPLLIINPALVVFITVPLFILLAIGIEKLLSEWYKLFPKNPYARGAGLVFIIGLIGVMILSGIDRFTNGYHYMPEAAREFSTDLNLVKEQLSKKPARTALIVSDSELPLYQALARYNDFDLSVATRPTGADSTNAIVARSAKDLVPQQWQLQGIITNDRIDEGDRLYLYKVIKNV